MQDSPAALPDPHQPTLTGIQFLAGLWFPAAWYPPAHRAAHLLDAWPRDQAGSRVYGFAEGELLLFPAPRAMDCGQCPGWPVIAVDTTALPAAAPPLRHRPPESGGNRRLPAAFSRCRPVVGGG